MSGPADQNMREGKALGEGGFGSEIAAGMSDTKNFKIVHNVQRGGCCWNPCGCINKSLQGRAYMVIGENYVEQNTPFSCLCCCTGDSIRKSYFDKQPFAEDCCESTFISCTGGGSFVTEKDTQYCCFVVPCHPLYDLCARPCIGGTVGRTCFAREKDLCFKCETRCCNHMQPILWCVGDSEDSAAILQERLDAFRARTGKSTSRFV